MATGKVSVPRRGDLSHDSRKPSGNCGAYVYGDFGFGVKNRSDLEIDVGYRAGKTGVFDNGTQVRRKEAIELDDGIVLPSQKKRKLSPVEHVRCSSSPMVNLDDDYQKPGQLDEEDFTHVPNISMSRWAYDDDDDDDDDDVGEHSSDFLGRVVRSSPESGVTQNDSSDVSGSRPSGSNGSVEDDCSESDMENEDLMELDVIDSDDCVASKSSLVYDDGAEAGISGKGSRNMLQGCRSVFKYKKLGKISEGSYGIVYKAMDEESREIVALKKMKMGNEREGFPVYYLREINTLMSMNHPSIVNVREVVVDDSNNGFDNIYMVMDYVEHDLKAVMQARKQPFRHSEVKCLMLQLLEGVKYLHDNWVLHRDLKTSNLLVNINGELKICDFGMSRQYGSPLKPYTALVVTLWYRAPELLLGAKEYSTAVDMWSVGCIMAELLASKPLFDGKTEFEQLDMIFRTLGTPNEDIWPGFSQLPGVKVNFVHQPYNQLHKKFPRASFTGSPVLSDLGLDLLSQLLTYDPEKRITALEALNHPWFQEVPFPNSREFVPTSLADKVVLAR